jgi:hypothetical protein
MAVVAPQAVSLTGLAATYNAASAGGDEVPADGRTVLHVKNASAAAVTLTVVTPGNLPTGAIPDAIVNVPAGGERFCGPFSNDLFGNAQNRAGLTWSATASVTFAALRF